MTKHLLLIDDHALFRSGVGLVLAAGLTDVQLYEAASLELALLCPCESVDLVLLDVQLEGSNGLDGIMLLKAKWPAVRLVVVSALQDGRVVQEALARGAHGFVCKTEAPARMLELIVRILADEVPAQVSSAGNESDNPSIRLTPRQCEVLELLCQGLPNKTIGRRLNLSENTVRGHVQATLLALQVSSRSEAAFVARRLGLSR